MEEKSWFADVILPFPIKSMFTYKIPGKFINKIQPGKRAIVQLKEGETIEFFEGA